MATRIDISVGYLSQIENSDRPVTPAFLSTRAFAFPAQLAAIDDGDEAALFVDVMEAALDPSV